MGVVGVESCWDVYGNGITGDDNLENLFSILDFPMESLEGNEFTGDWDISEPQCLGPIPPNVLIDPMMNAGSLCLSFAPDVSTSETPKLKQVSDDIQKPLGSGILHPLKVTESRFFQSQSPNSVLESSGSCSTQKILQKGVIPVPVRARSKRVKAAVNPWLSISPLITISASSKGKKERHRKKVISSPHPVSTENQNEDSQNAGIFQLMVEPTKKCTHCEVSKTPQWREGPAGPKTLCNACGVRYRSGRLFPEYRPAASPTFMPTIHSNSHKKVIEMRNKGKRVTPGKPSESDVPMSTRHLFESSG